MFMHVVYWQAQGTEAPSVTSDGVNFCLSSYRCSADTVGFAAQATVTAPISIRNGFSAKHPTVKLETSFQIELFGGKGPSRKHPDSLDTASPAQGGKLVSSWFSVSAVLLLLDAVIS